ncbi:hypothetical protein N7520_009782 [Penicillium odoratum]|uniref:uncharacterized protein n=1 Tax=Penicillium odoratum TaxID=1167516 RepID=UPI002547D263|nr:uncharacterized protein N7520_009782 [Penicillium odoratum]KAJ5752865.1 hypothetical protein N7520_009782 [Penicillium odoratum]
MTFNPATEIRITYRQIPSWNRIPNTSIQHKPVMIYHGAFNATPVDLERRLKAVGVVGPQWTYTMYTLTHFHSTTHEVLGVVAGRARLCFGGEGNPERFEPVVQHGDLIIVPAGVGHRLLTDEGEEPFEMVGSYPHNKEWDMCYGQAGEESKVQGIQDVAWFDRDPLYGDHGPALDI